VSAKKKLSKQQIIDLLDQQINHLLHVMCDDAGAECANDLAGIVVQLRFIMKEMK